FFLWRREANGGGCLILQHKLSSAWVKFLRFLLNSGETAVFPHFWSPCLIAGPQIIVQTLPRLQTARRARRKPGYRKPPMRKIISAVQPVTDPGQNAW
ncbi:TPA: hypothetical protein ACKP8B_005279, partial [Serratia marcescens]